MYNQTIGKFGELLVAKYLKKNNYKILNTHWQKRIGEIDIIAHDLQTEELVFIEVKTRTSRVFGWPEEKVTPSKKRKILKTAQWYLFKNKHPYNTSWRIDIIGVELNRTKNKADISHYRNISL